MINYKSNNNFNKINIKNNFKIHKKSFLKKLIIPINFKVFLKINNN